MCPLNGGADSTTGYVQWCRGGCPLARLIRARHPCLPNAAVANRPKPNRRRWPVLEDEPLPLDDPHQRLPRARPGPASWAPAATRAARGRQSHRARPHRGAARGDRQPAGVGEGAHRRRGRRRRHRRARPRAPAAAMLDAIDSLWPTWPEPGHWTSRSWNTSPSGSRTSTRRTTGSRGAETIRPLDRVSGTAQGRPRHARPIRSASRSAISSKAGSCPPAKIRHGIRADRSSSGADPPHKAAARPSADGH